MIRWFQRGQLTKNTLIRESNRYTLYSIPSKRNLREIGMKWKE